MNALFAAAADLQRVLAAKGWRSTIIGGLAVQRWGEPRQTRDVDVALFTGFGDEASFVDHLLELRRHSLPDSRRGRIRPVWWGSPLHAPPQKG